jgi:hypothetical protein
MGTLLTGTLSGHAKYPQNIGLITYRPKSGFDGCGVMPYGNFGSRYPIPTYKLIIMVNSLLEG